MAADQSRVARALMCLSDLLSTAQEGASSTDPAEAETFGDLAKALPPVATALQALLPEAKPQARVQDLLALSAEVERLTGRRGPEQVGAVEALHRNAGQAARESERAQVARVVDEMVRDGQIGPHERGHYEGYTLARIRPLREDLRKDPPAQGAASVGSPIEATPPEDKARVDARKRAARALGLEVANGAHG